jgi:hypothetical protein
VSRISYLLALLVIFAAGTICAADVGTDQAKENDELKTRIEKLEKELAELKQMVRQQENTRAKDINNIEQRTSNLEQRTPAAEPVKPAPGKKAVVSGLDIEVYGRLKLDAAYDTSRTSTGDFAQWVEPENLNKNDNQFNMTANETRLGLNIKGPETADFKTGGRVEIDFYGGGAENKSNPMLRHAYMNLDWPQEKFSILAGQTSDVISPLFPYTLNYSVGWWAGNIGYRRPQIRLTKGYMLGPDTALKLEAAVARTIGQTGTFTPGDAGEDAGIPSFQARTSVTFPWWGYKPTTIGFSGHYAKEEFDVNARDNHKNFDSWSLNLDLTQPVNEWLTIKGEMFHGKNLSAYLGGIGQGVRNIGTTAAPILDKEIASTGGWAAAQLGPWDKWSFNAGFGIDDPKNDDLSYVTNSNREYNRMIFGNVIYSIDKNAQIGFELSQWHTKYKGLGNADSIRAQTSFIYNF